MSEDDLPQMDVSKLRLAAASLHELYQTLQEVGFTRWEALYMLGVLMAASAGGASGGKS